MNAATGQPYSHVYLERGGPLGDSPRLRRRLYAFVSSHQTFHISLFEDALRMFGGFEFDSLKNFYVHAPLVDVLDSVTHIARHLGRWQPEATSWVRFAASAIREENVAFKVDAKGGVHPYVDEEFERSRVAAVAALEGAQYRAAAASLEDAFRHLKEGDRKASIRSIFEAVETVGRQIAPIPRLTKNTVKDALTIAYLQPILDSTERDVSRTMLLGLAHWTDALHGYRHGQPAAMPVLPSIELTVYALSTGCAHLRWLAPRVPTDAGQPPPITDDGAA